MPHAIGYAYVAEHASITFAEPPFTLPRYDLKQHWHRKFHNDPRITWLRGLVASLFNDDRDEWPKYPAPASAKKIAMPRSGNMAKRETNPGE